MNQPDPAGVVWIDGEAVPTRLARIDAGGPALLGGVGLFETLAVREGAVLDLDEHLDRLARGATRLGIEIPAREAWVKPLLGAATEPAGGAGWVKLVLTGSGQTIVFSGVSDPRREGRPCTAVILKWRRNPFGPLSGVKSLGYAENLVALKRAQRRGADEGLWLSPRGHLAEGCTSNLFVVRHGRLFTPALSEGILPGVVRQKVIQAARRLGMQVHEGKLRVRKLLEAGEAFLTSSLRGVAALVQVDGRPVGRGVSGPCTVRLSGEVAKLRIPSPGGGKVFPVGTPRNDGERA